MKQPDREDTEEIILREAGALLGISRKGVQHLVNQELLRRELRTSPAGTKYGIVFRSDVLRLAEERRKHAAKAEMHRGPGRPLKLPEQPTTDGVPEKMLRSEEREKLSQRCCVEEGNNEPATPSNHRGTNRSRRGADR